MKIAVARLGFVFTLHFGIRTVKVILKLVLTTAVFIRPL